MNKAFIVGRLGDAPKRVNEKVVTFDIATQNGKDKPPTWHRVKTFEKLADTVERYLDKGQPAAIEGSINNYAYTNNQGVKMYGSEIVASRVEFWGTNKESKESEAQAFRAEQKYPESFGDCPF
jgi:single-strand DNA-binding protein